MLSGAESAAEMLVSPLALVVHLAPKQASSVCADILRVPCLRVWWHRHAAAAALVYMLQATGLDVRGVEDWLHDGESVWVVCELLCEYAFCWCSGRAPRRRDPFRRWKLRHRAAVSRSRVLNALL